MKLIVNLKISWYNLHLLLPIIFDLRRVSFPSFSSLRFQITTCVAIDFFVLGGNKKLDASVAPITRKENLNWGSDKFICFQICRDEESGKG